MNLPAQRFSVLSPLLLACGVLSGCATLPTSGPTGREVRRDTAGAELLGFTIVDIDGPTAIVAAEAILPARTSLASLAADGMVDTLGPGDVLSVDIFEVGTGLFNGAASSLGGRDAGPAMPSAQDSPIGGVVVDRDGAITLPYIGRIVVAGLTPAQVQERVQRGLRGLSQNPQAIVTVRRNLSNTVVVQGAIAKPGRQELALSRDRLLDAIAAAGGTGEQPQEDMVVRLTRRGSSVEQLLSSIRSGTADDLVLLPGDRIQVLRRPQSFTVFGAATVSQVSFGTPTLSLAEALARAGGPSEERADPRSVFIFRYPRTADGAPLPFVGGGAADAAPHPIIYRLDMMRPASYFLAQRFAMRDKDVIYVANAAANRPAKLVAIINQLFSPIITARALTR